MPGATNVIPGKVSFTMDIRSQSDMHRKRAVADIVRQIEAIAKRRELALQIDVTHENRSVPCAPWLKALIAEDPDAEHHCVRCHAVVHYRKPDHLARTWALLLAAMVFYIPANVLPVMKVISPSPTCLDSAPRPSPRSQMASWVT